MMSEVLPSTLNWLGFQPASTHSAWLVGKPTSCGWNPRCQHKVSHLLTLVYFSFNIILQKTTPTHRLAGLMPCCSSCFSSCLMRTRAKSSSLRIFHRCESHTGSLQRWRRRISWALYTAPWNVRDWPMLWNREIWILT